MLQKDVYRIVGIEYGACLCENCGRALTNIATMQGEESGKVYRVGLDCAANLEGAGYTVVGVEKSVHTFRNRARFKKIWKAYKATREKDGIVYFYTFKPKNERQEKMWEYRFSVEVLENMGIIIK